MLESLHHQIEILDDLHVLTMTNPQVFEIGAVGEKLTLVDRIVDENLPEHQRHAFQSLTWRSKVW